MQGNNLKLENGEFNFARCTMAHRIIDEVLQYQHDVYQLTPIPEIQRLLEGFPHKTEKELYAMSLEVEPRGAQRADLA